MHLLIVLIFNKKVNLFNNLKKQSENNTSFVLLNLKDFKEDKEIDKLNKFISQKNVKSSGKLTKKKGLDNIKLKDKFNTLNKIEKQQIKKGEKITFNKEYFPKKKDEIIKNNSKDKVQAKKGKENKIEKKDSEKQENNSVLLQGNKGLDNNNVTEKTIPNYVKLNNETDVRLNLDDDQLFKIGSKKWIYAEFWNRFFSPIKDIFKQMIYGDIIKNSTLVKADSVITLALVDRKGNINFRKFFKKSTTQEWLNHISYKSIDYAGNIGSVPSGLFKDKKQEFFIIAVQFTYSGPPKYVWTISIPNIKESKNEK